MPFASGRLDVLYVRPLTLFLLLRGIMRLNQERGQPSGEMPSKKLSWVHLHFQKTKTARLLRQSYKRNRLKPSLVRPRGLSRQREKHHAHVVCRDPSQQPYPP